MDKHKPTNKSTGFRCSLLYPLTTTGKGRSQNRGKNSSPIILSQFKIKQTDAKMIVHPTMKKKKNIPKSQNQPSGNEKFHPTFLSIRKNSSSTPTQTRFFSTRNEKKILNPTENNSSFSTL